MTRILGAKAAAVIGLLFAIEAAGGIQNSHHDFSSAGWSGGELCIVCHTPHNADTSAANAPLWNHALTSASYVLYSSDTLDATPGQPNGVSKLCLSCHDGSVAVDTYASNPGGTFYVSFGDITTDLRPHHPISFDYDSNLATADGDLNDPDATPSGLGGTISEDLLRSGRMECTSCHDVHIMRNTQGCTGCHDMGPPLVTISLSLWKSNAGSALCLTCHDK